MEYKHYLWNNNTLCPINCLPWFNLTSYLMLCCTEHVNAASEVYYNFCDARNVSLRKGSISQHIYILPFPFKFLQHTNIRQQRTPTCISTVPHFCHIEFTKFAPLNYHKLSLFISEENHTKLGMITTFWYLSFDGCFYRLVSSHYPSNNTNQCSPEHQSTVSDLGLNVALQK